MPNPIFNRRLLAAAQVAAASLDPVATAWEARVIANGGADPSAAYVQAVSDLVSGMKADGVWSKMIFVHGVVPGPIVGINPPASSCYAPNTPILVGPSVNELLNNNGQHAASVWPVAGSSIITLDGLNNWTSDLGCTSSVMWGVGQGASATNIGWSVYVFTENSNPVFGCTDNVVGTNNSAPSAGAWTLECGSCCGSAGSFTPGFTKGFFSVNRTATNVLKIHAANSSNAPATVYTFSGNDTSDPRQNAFSVYFHGRNGPAATVNGSYILSLNLCHQALTLADFTFVYNRVQAFRTAIGGGFV